MSRKETVNCTAKWDKQ